MKDLNFWELKTRQAYSLGNRLYAKACFTRANEAWAFANKLDKALQTHRYQLQTRKG